MQFSRIDFIYWGAGLVIQEKGLIGNQIGKNYL